MSHVVREWLAANPAGRATAVDLTPPDAVVQAFWSPVADRIAFHAGDVTDVALWQHLAADAAEVTHVVHGAAVTSINRLTRGPDGQADPAGALPALEANIMGTAGLLAWAAERTRLRRLVYVSSGSVYRGAGPDPLPEEGYVEPTGLYPISKHAGELLTAQMAAQFGLPAVSVRLSGVYGPLDRETTTRAVTPVVFKLLRGAMDRQTLRLAGLDAVGDYIHAGDVGRAIAALLACHEIRHPVYNVAYGEAVTLRDLAALVQDLVPGAEWTEAAADGADVALDPTLRSGRWGAYDISRIRRDAGWAPRPLSDALADYRDWLAQHPY